MVAQSKFKTACAFLLIGANATSNTGGDTQVEQPQPQQNDQQQQQENQKVEDVKEQQDNDQQQNVNQENQKQNVQEEEDVKQEEEKEDVKQVKTVQIPKSIQDNFKDNLSEISTDDEDNCDRNCLELQLEVFESYKESHPSLEPVKKTDMQTATDLQKAVDEIEKLLEKQRENNQLFNIMDQSATTLAASKKVEFAENFEDHVLAPLLNQLDNTYTEDANTAITAIRKEFAKKQEERNTNEKFSEQITALKSQIGIVESAEKIKAFLKATGQNEDAIQFKNDTKSLWNEIHGLRKQMDKPITLKGSELQGKLPKKDGIFAKLFTNAEDKLTLEDATAAIREAAVVKYREDLTKALTNKEGSKEEDEKICENSKEKEKCKKYLQLFRELITAAGDCEDLEKLKQVSGDDNLSDDDKKSSAYKVAMHKCVAEVQKEAAKKW